jgi:hypothetical protein
MNLSNVKHMDRNDLLGLLGLSTRQSTAGQLVEVLATFGVGLLMGAGVALLLAPKPGRELRDEIRTRLAPVREEVAPT